MSNINQVVVSGNLTRDPELKATRGGSSVLEFSVAVNDRVKEGNEWKDRPNYIDCVLFGSRADSLSKFMHKGDKVAVTGRLHWSSWEKDGQKRSKVNVYVDSVELMTKRDGQQKDAGTRAVEEYYGVTAEPVYDVYDEDIPF